MRSAIAMCIIDVEDVLCFGKDHTTLPYLHDIFVYLRLDALARDRHPTQELYSLINIRTQTSSRRKPALVEAGFRVWNLDPWP